MLGLAVARVLRLERGHIGAEDEVSVGGDSFDRGPHVSLDGGVLSFQINER